jgi:YidC/Oxa1 family membrane protein insertase
MIENRNTILAVILSGLVLIAWQYFYNIPTMEKQRAAQQIEQAQKQAANPATPTPSQPPVPGGTAAPAANVPVQSRPTVIAAGPRVNIETPSIKGSIALTGARIDDVALVKYRETVDPKSPAIELFSPSGTKEPFYAEFGFVPSAGSTTKMPDKATVWKQEGANALTPTTPVTLTWNNGQGLTFKRTISIDDKYLFTIKDDVANVGDAAVTLYPFGLISRHGTPAVSGYYILHEGLIGVLGDQGLQEYGYKKMDDTKAVEFKVTNAWLGITDKYWAATLLPSPTAAVQARFSSTTTSLFAGAKESATVDAYDKQLSLNKFDRLIDWGWFYFITKPMFWMIDWFFHIVGNFGVAILLVTVLVKLVFFPLASKSYASMAKMKAVQPQLAALKEKYPDDKVKQQQEMMEIYKKEKINPIAGCLPILIQIPVFFSLYKVLFVTIEMRHAPFFGWIKDLSAPDPTNLFNLFGLFAFDPTQLPVLGYYLHLGIWPILMGITMWFQMKLNPTPPDPTQKMIFDWMPLIFTFMLAGFPAGLVIYWAWNNLLSVLQQSYIMNKNGAKVELFDNVKALFVGSKKTT